MRSSLFLFVTQSRLVAYDVSGQPIGLLMGPTGCSETSVSNYQPTLRNMQEDRRSRLLIFSYSKSCVLLSEFRTPIKATFINTDCHVRKVDNWLRLWGCMWPRGGLKSCDLGAYTPLHVSLKYVLHITPSR